MLTETLLLSPEALRYDDYSNMLMRSSVVMYAFLRSPWTCQPLPLLSVTLWRWMSTSVSQSSPVLPSYLCQTPLAQYGTVPPL